jgi:hypothetical protein
MTQEETELLELIERVDQAVKHYSYYKTDYGLACMYCSDKARNKSENKNIFIMSPCLELDAIYGKTNV